MNMKTLTVPGTCSYHKLCLIPVDDIGHKKVSDDNMFAGTITFSKATNSKTNFDSISANESG